MRRITPCVGGTNIAPGQSVQSSYGVVVGSAVVGIYIESLSNASDVIERDQNRQDDGADGDENDEVLETNHSSYHGEKVVGRRFGSFAFGDKICFGFTRECQYGSDSREPMGGKYKIRGRLLRRSAKIDVWMAKMTKAVVMEVMNVTMPIPDCDCAFEAGSEVFLAARMMRDRISSGAGSEAAMACEGSSQADPSSIMATEEETRRGCTLSMAMADARGVSIFLQRDGLSNIDFPSVEGNYCGQQCAAIGTNIGKGSLWEIAPVQMSDEVARFRIPANSAVYFRVGLLSEGSQGLYAMLVRTKECEVKETA